MSCPVQVFASSCRNAAELHVLLAVFAPGHVRCEGRQKQKKYDRSNTFGNRCC
jgi:hypothetical protein